MISTVHMVISIFGLIGIPCFLHSHTNREVHFRLASDFQFLSFEIPGTVAKVRRCIDYFMQIILMTPFKARVLYSTDYPGVEKRNYAAVSEGIVLARTP